MMRRAHCFSFSLFLAVVAVFVGACGHPVDNDTVQSPIVPDAGVDAPFVPPVPTLLAGAPGSAFCGSIGACRMFVEGGQVFFDSITPVDGGGQSSAILAVPVGGGAVTTVATTGYGLTVGPFASANGIEWFETSDEPFVSALYTSGGTGTEGTLLATYTFDDGGPGGFGAEFVLGSDDANSIYLVSPVPTVVAISKSDGKVEFVSTSAESEVTGAPFPVVVDSDPSGLVYQGGLQFSKTNGESSPIPWNCPGGACAAAGVGDGVVFGLFGDGLGSPIVALSGGVTTQLWTLASGGGGLQETQAFGVVADSQNVYWISTNGIDSSTLRRAPIQGNVSAEVLLTDTTPGPAPCGLTGVALDGTFVYVTTGDGRLLRLPK